MLSIQIPPPPSKPLEALARLLAEAQKAAEQRASGSFKGGLEEII